MIKDDVNLLPSLEKEEELLSKIYEDVNDLYTDEHQIMVQADLLEQLNQQVAAMHALTNKMELDENTKRQAQLEARKVDPDSFPINRLTADLVQTYTSVWKE